MNAENPVNIWTTYLCLNIISIYINGLPINISYEATIVHIIYIK